MALDADLIVDRRRLRRKLAFWRFLGVLAALAVVTAAGLLTASRTGALDAPGATHIARIRIGGFITYDRPLLRAIEQVAENDRARALILQIDSPGGSTTGSEALYAAIRRVAERKPVVATVGVLGASGAYVAALGADRIVSGETSLVGSIGVVVQWAEIDQLLQTLGIRFQSIKTSPIKASPNGFEPTPEEARAALRAVVGDSYQWFTDLVRTRRNLNEEQLRTVADGRVFTGRQSVDLHLVDELGDERAAIRWLERERQVAERLPVRNYEPARDGVAGFIGMAARAAAEGLGLPTGWLSAVASPDARLDGLVSLWHPALSFSR